MHHGVRYVSILGNIRDSVPPMFLFNYFVPVCVNTTDILQKSVCGCTSELELGSGKYIS